MMISKVSIILVLIQVGIITGKKDVGQSAFFLNSAG